MPHPRIRTNISKRKLAIYHDLYFRIPVQLLFLPRTAFCSFKRWIHHQLFFFAKLFYRSALARYFLFAAFKMGVKSVRIATILMRSQHDAFFPIHHDSFFFAAISIFRCTAIFLIVHQTFLLEMGWRHRLRGRERV